MQSGEGEGRASPPRMALSSAGQAGLPPQAAWAALRQKQVLGDQAQKEEEEGD